MSGSRRRQINLASTGSVLDEMYGQNTTAEPAAEAEPDAGIPEVPEPPEPESTPAPAPVPARQELPSGWVRPLTAEQRGSTPPPTRVQHPATRVQHPTDTVPPANSVARRAANSTRTPAGKKRYTIYIDDDVAAQLDAAADRLGKDLRGLVPKHRILGELLQAGIGQSAVVAAQLRAGLLDGLQDPGSST